MGSEETDLSIACLKAKMEEPTDAVLSTSWRVVEDEAEATSEESDVGMKFHRGHDSPFAFTGVLFDDSLARLDLTESRCPAFEVLVCGVWHESTNVDVGDTFRVLKAFGQAQLVLVGPQSWYSTWNGWISLSQLIQVDHLIALIVRTLHRLNGTGNVLLTDSGCCIVGVGVVRILFWIACTANDRRQWTVFFV